VIGRRVIAVGVNVVDGVIGVILEIATQVVCGADDADVIGVTPARGRVRWRVRSRFVNGAGLPGLREPLAATGFPHTHRASTSLVEASTNEDWEGAGVEVKIGITDSPRELVFTSTQTPSEVEALVSAALGKDSDVLGLTDDKGRRFLVHSTKIAYVEIGAADSRRVGFGIGSGLPAKSG
jgi:Protein of unknown function (DUF3107)